MTRPIKRLYRSRSDAKILGLCGGLGDYLEVDPTILRLLWVLITVMTGFVFGILGYFIAGLIVPVEPWAPAPSSDPASPPPGSTQQQHG